MRLVSLRALEPGQKLALPIFTTSGRIILNAGVILTESYIQKLSTFELNKIYIHDARFDDIVIYSPLDWETKKFAQLTLNDTLINITKNKSIDEYVIQDAAQKIIRKVFEFKEMGVSLLTLSAVDNYIIEHSINVAILAAFIGIKLRLNWNQLGTLVTGALIHDIGRENSKYENEDHVQRGYDIMRKCRGLHLSSIHIINEHHENFDGSGYPRKLKGSSIQLFSRIVRVADEYDNALRGYYNQSSSLMPHQAYEVLLALSSKVLDPYLVECFRDIIVFYPNGCTVILNNGFVGVVIKQNNSSPQRPIIRELQNKEHLNEIDLIKNLNLSISDVSVA